MIAVVPTVYPKKYAHGFVVLCFVVVMQSFIMNSHEVFIHIHQACFAGTGAIVRLPQCQWSKPAGYGKISHCITTTKHSKAKTVCIFLGIYCIKTHHDGLKDKLRNTFSLRLRPCLTWSNTEWKRVPSCQNAWQYWWHSYIYSYLYCKVVWIQFNYVIKRKRNSWIGVKGNSCVNLVNDGVAHLVHLLYI